MGGGYIIIGGWGGGGTYSQGERREAGPHTDKIASRLHQFF